MTKKLTQEEVIRRFVEVHGSAYDYSEVNYTGNHSKVKIICNEHKITFLQAPAQHMIGQISCHTCVVNKKMASRVAKRKSQVVEGYKTCRKCSVAQTYTEFIPNKMGTYGYYSVCRGCCSKRFKAKRQDPTYRLSIKKLNQAYTRNNKDKANVKSAKRRAARLQATPKWAEGEFEIFFMKEAYNLAIMRGVATGFNWQVDHQVPLNSELCCGLHCMANIAVIPEVVNKSKSNRHWPDMWQLKELNDSH